MISILFFTAALKLNAADLNHTHYKLIYLLQKQTKTTLQVKSNVRLTQNHLKMLAGALLRLT